MGILQFDSRKTYFDGCGTTITGAQKTEQAIKLAGLDYVVEKQQLRLPNGDEAKGCFANVRTDTNKVLGAVGPNYEVLQNREAFDFMDSFIEGGANFVNAGNIQDGKRAYIIAETEPMKILGDEFAPYILFTNSFDGSTGVQAMFTPVRVFCSNCFVMASAQAENKIRIKHSKSIKDRLEIARDTMLQNTRYLQHLKAVSEELAATRVTKEQFESIVEELVPIKPENTQVTVDRQEQFRQQIMTAYNQDDLQNFNDTAYKVLMAISDAESHKAPVRLTGNEFVYLERVMWGMGLLNAAQKIMQARYGVRHF